MNFLNSDWRDRRQALNHGNTYHPMHYTIANYSTTSRINKTTNMKPFEDEFLTKIHSIPDPLRKNLADTVITSNKNKEEPITPVEDKEFFFEANFPPVNMENTTHRSDFYPTLTGITSFFSNVFGAISGAVFHRRPKSPVSQYHDCFDDDSHIDQEMAADDWQPANNLDENKRAETQSSVVNDNMSYCRASVARYENKLNSVRNQLKNTSVPVKNNITVLCRRPKKAFVEASAVKTSSDEFAAENYVSLSNEEYVEYFAVPNNNSEQHCDTKGAKMKTELAKTENTEIVSVIPEVIERIELKNLPENLESSVPKPPVIETAQKDDKKEIISSCEDKMAKLKAMLQERKKPLRSSSSSVSSVESKNIEVKPTTSETITKTETKTTKSITGKTIDNQSMSPNMIDTNPKSIVTHKPPIKPTKVIPIDKKQDKRFKNPHRLTEKRKKSRMKKNIQDDVNFANEIDSEDISSSVDGSPVSPIKRIQKRIPIPALKDCFDETKGRFHSGTPDSDDSFQIVFADSPKLTRIRKSSDCDSEDSFIVFEDSPDSCYTSNDVFGEGVTSDESDLSDSDSEISDSGCANDVCQLSHSFSRTVSDLTDDSLYEDSKPIEKTDIFEELSPPVKDEVDCAVSFRDINNSDVPSGSDVVKTGLLIDEEKKRRRKDQPPKKVTFSTQPPSVRVMRVWAFAARQARAGHWERHALDRERFKRRIADVDMAVSWVLKPQHRRRIMFQRFMPWWNQQKRKEAAEKKKRQEEEIIKKKQEDLMLEDFEGEVSMISEHDEEMFNFYRYLDGGYIELNKTNIENCNIDFKDVEVNGENTDNSNIISTNTENCNILSTNTENYNILSNNTENSNFDSRNFEMNSDTNKNDNIYVMNEEMCSNKDKNICMDNAETNNNVAAEKT